MLPAALWPWIGFNAFVLALLALDLGVFHRTSRAVSLKEAAFWSVVWVALAMLFNVGIYVFKGFDVAIQFFTGYLIEKSLSVDNIFIFVLLFSAFHVSAAYQHRVLFWGILGALIMRGILIATGTFLLEQVHWIIYLFGAFLIFTGIRMFLRREEVVHPEKNVLLKLARRWLPITQTYVEDRFLVRRSGKQAKYVEGNRRWMVTPLLLVLLVVESTDLLFAVDSIPAVFAVTNDPFIVYTSNVFAILGLRSLYFLFAGVINKFYYLKVALAIILVYVGVKMVLADVYHIPTLLSLAVIACVLSIAILASVIRSRRMVVRRGAEHSRVP